MNFLQIVQEAWIYAPINGDVPTTLSGTLVEEGELIKRFVAMEWEKLQNERQDWRWKRKSITFNTVADRQVYTPDELELTDFESWDRTRFRTQEASDKDDIPVRVMDEFNFVDMATLTGPRNQDGGWPIWITILEDDRSLRLYPIPNDTYSVHAIYRTERTRLVSDTDTPDMPARYHSYLSWAAVSNMAKRRGAQNVLMASEDNAADYHLQIVQHQTEDIVLGNQPLVF